jgi:hypothetical protein
VAGFFLVLSISFLFWLSQLTLGDRARDTQAKTTLLAMSVSIDQFEEVRRGVISNLPGEGTDALTDAPLASTLDDLFSESPQENSLVYAGTIPEVPGSDYRFQYYVPETPATGIREIAFTDKYLLFTNLVEQRGTYFVVTSKRSQSTTQRDPSLTTLTFSSCEQQEGAPTKITIQSQKDGTRQQSIEIVRNSIGTIDVLPGNYRIRFPTKGVIPSRIYGTSEEGQEGRECTGEQLPGTVPGLGLPLGFIDVTIPGPITSFSSRLITNEELLVNGKPVR